MLTTVQIEVDLVMLWIQAINIPCFGALMLLSNFQYDIKIQLKLEFNMLSLVSTWCPMDIPLFMFLKSSSTQMHNQIHMCTSIKEDIMTCYHQVTSLSYSTIALYNTDHTGVGVGHKITSPKNTASIFPNYDVA